MQTIWIAGPSVIVLALAVFGTVSLVTSHGAGAGEGPAPIWSPPGAELTAAQQTAPWAPGKPLVVQVIGQQWRFTYRYPQFGRVGQPKPMLPPRPWVPFHVTPTL